MALTRKEKEEQVSQLTEMFKNAGSVVFVNFHGLNVSRERDMRSKLREEGVSYAVAKKTLAKIALEQSGITGTNPELNGELAIAWSNDATLPARKIYSFQKEYNDAVAILGGIFEGTLKNKEQMTEIAEIPSLEVLRGMFVNVINSPIQGLAIALNAVAEKKGQVA